MLGWERSPEESDKAYSAFALYRDLGPERSLLAVAECLYGQRSKYDIRTVEKWSSRFDWVDRVKALEARDEILRREAIEQHMQTRASDFAARRAALLARMLDLSEKAADNAEMMLSWPLSEQRALREDEDGEDVTVIVMPARCRLHQGEPLYPE